MPRSCVFCDGPADSKEHAYPDWLTDVLPGEGALKHARGDDPDTQRRWDAAGFDVQVRQVCRTCNNGWMSRLEVRAQELLTPLILGTRTGSLSVAEQKTIAAWAWKTGAMLALAHPNDERYVTPPDYGYFREHQRPPRGTYVWIARVEPDIGVSDFQAGFSKQHRTDYRRPGDPEIDRVGYRLQFSVFAAVFDVIKDPYEARLSRPPGVRDYWCRVQPISKGEWPPPRQMTLRDLHELHTGRYFNMQ
jgi:hypothetical protein